MRKRPLFFIACIFLTGLCFQKYHSWEFLMPCIIFVSREIYLGLKNNNQKKVAGRSVILLSAFLLGTTHMYHSEQFRDTYMSKIEDGSTVTIWGEIKNIETTERSIRTILTDCYIRLNEEILPCNDVMVYASSNHFQVGNVYQITGQIHKFEKPRNEGGFDSVTFYQARKIDFYLYEDSAILKKENESVIQKGILWLKEKMELVYRRDLKEKEAGFFLAMVLGNKTNLDESLKELFTLGGISHIIAISGLHVSIIGRGTYNRLRKRKMGFAIAGVLSAFLLLSYGFMVGNSLSTVRAIGMLLIFFLSQYLGRSYDMLNAFGAMCIAFLWENPFVIEYSGFWFSATALIGIGYVGDVFAKDVKIGKGFWSCMGIWLSTLPVVAACYYEVPLYASLVNMIVLPTLAPLFCVALFAGVIGIWIPGVSEICLNVSAWGILAYEWICKCVQGLKGASIITGSPTVMQIGIYYILLFTGVFVIKRWLCEKERARFRWQIILSIVCFLIIVFPKENNFEITFLDVGQGDAIYICDGEEMTCFIDGGSMDVDDVGHNHILPFLKSKGIREIDYWFVSHADTDHISGLLEVLEDGYKIKHLVVAKEAIVEENEEQLIETAADADVPIIYMKPRDKICSKNMEITCLYPGKSEAEDRNDRSLVLLLNAHTSEGEMTALFAGDISAEVERELVSEGVMQQVDVFKVIHHGSKYSNSQELIDVILPKIAVVSCSKKNSYGHPHEDTLERLDNAGCEVWNTAEWGQITLDYSGVEVY